MADSVNIRELNDLIASKRNFIDAIIQGMDQTIVGQKHLVDSLLIALLANGHILLEGVPGLAKTLAIKTLASIIDAKYSRIQFTPDLLPADVVGTMVYSVQKEKFEVNQPCASQGAECAARSHAGAPSDHRRPHLQTRRPILGDGYPKPYRAGRHLPSA